MEMIHYVMYGVAGVVCLISYAIAFKLEAKATGKVNEELPGVLLFALVLPPIAFPLLILGIICDWVNKDIVKKPEPR